VNGFVGGNLAAIPQITFMGGEIFFGRRDENLIGSLVLPALGAFVSPEKPGAVQIHAHGIGHVFAAKFRWGKRGSGGERESEGER